MKAYHLGVLKSGYRHPAGVLKARIALEADNGAPHPRANHGRINAAIAIRERLLGWRASLIALFDRLTELIPGRQARPLGREGEDSAARYLARHGYRILRRNFRTARGEIDLIATDRETLVFVEVKARLDDRMGTPAAAVDQRKQDRIRRAAEWYCARYRLRDRLIRFDVVAISGRGPSRRIEVLKDAF